MELVVMGPQTRKINKYLTPASTNIYTQLLTHQCNTLSYQHNYIYTIINQGCTNRRCLVAWATRFVMAMPEIYIKISIMLLFLHAEKSSVQMHQAKSTRWQWVIDYLKNVGLPAWKLFDITSPVPRIWKSLLDFWEICGPLSSTPPPPPGGGWLEACEFGNGI
jgi:hypothetical protein